MNALGRSRCNDVAQSIQVDLAVDLQQELDTADVQPHRGGQLLAGLEHAARSRGIGAAVVVQLELEAALHGCRAVWLLTEGASSFFERLGYARCDRAVVPPKIRETQQFASLCPAGAEVLVKRLPV